ncbi:WYL domain-containing protein [Catenovulum adriaticum]|uniref:WYL domain-containing protein n=1 Tax=Catenovulum adriaticum TaxID=2984846 RepID=A0ABY7AQ39_9ALTE|nr:WYL domain-containing protein [Catenovulum sp. TS8]WAJ71256.1 WYL domain-containing protein [Catenovulum sp. TS8]
MPAHFVEPSLVANLLTAIEQQKRIEVDYISLRSTEYDGRIIAPHHFVYDGLRWHVRAFDEKHQAFLDFNLSRFQGAGEIEENTIKPPTAQDDNEWQTQVDVVIVPDPRLSPAQKACIEREYQMQNGQLIIQCRAALVKYVLLRLRLDIYKNTAEAQQIMLEPNCQKALKPYVPG